jgi:hypothetical protein
MEPTISNNVIDAMYNSNAARLRETLIGDIQTLESGGVLFAFVSRAIKNITWERCKNAYVPGGVDVDWAQDF